MIRLRFVSRAELAPAGHWLASKRGDECVADVLLPGPDAPVAGPTPMPLNVAPLSPLLAADRGRSPVFRFSFKLVQTARIEGLDDVPMYESDTYELVDQWAGDPARACLCLEDDLQRLVLRPHRRVVVTGGYVNA